MTLDDRLRAMRRRLGLSQAAAARIFNVTDTTWQNWEYTGKAPGPARVLAMLMEPTMIHECVAILSQKSAAEHGDGWESVGVYKSPEGRFSLVGQGGPASAWAQTHAPLVSHREEISAEAADRLMAGIGVLSPADSYS